MCAVRAVAAGLLAVVVVGAVAPAVEGQEDDSAVADSPEPAPASSASPTPVLSVEVSSSASRLVTGPFEVQIEFARPVSGFEVGEIRIVNGSAAKLAGSGADYRALITPEADGTVVVRIPADAAFDDTGGGNLPSSLFTRTSVERRPTSGSESIGPGIDTWDRAAVLAEYRAEFQRTEPDAGYTGNVDDCVAGTTSQEFRDSILQRINWYRRMAGVDVVTERAEYTADAQSAALIMAAEGELSHDPASSWDCYTSQGARGAGKSNLHYWAGFSGYQYGGVYAIDGYMRDSGDNNLAVAHRRWIFEPGVRQMGIGKAYAPSISGDALYVLDSGFSGRRSDIREIRDFVAWPPSGYVPAETVWGRWSLTPSGTADYSDATVTVVSESGPIAVEIIHRETYRGFPRPAIVWAMDGDTESSPSQEPIHGDQCYTVTVSGVKVNRVRQDPYEYVTCLLDLSIESTDLTGVFAPQALETDSITHNSISLSWGLVTQPAEVAVNHYIVERFDGVDWVEGRRGCVVRPRRSPTTPWRDWSPRPNTTSGSGSTPRTAASSTR